MDFSYQNNGEKKQTMKITNPYGPNTTILLPGSCNAKCDFCFWNREAAKIKPDPEYLNRVFHILKNLSSNFSVLSISGGEPTLSPFFRKFLARLGVYRRKNSLDRVVLTTHGGELDSFITPIGCVIDHLNISRHGIGTEDNYKIFKTTAIPSDDELRNSISKLHSETITDVTLNCVIYPDVTEAFCNDFIEYAKDLGADAVSFRKVASDVSPTKTENLFVSNYGIVNATDCPVCRGLVQNVNGFEVRWKGSVMEPSIATKGVYEVIIHPDGHLYRDWGMNHRMEFEVIEDEDEEDEDEDEEDDLAWGVGGCGGGGGGVGGC